MKSDLVMQVLLVAGGLNYIGAETGGNRLDSTEVLEAGGTWRLTAPLPSARLGITAAVLDNTIFVFGD